MSGDAAYARDTIAKGSKSFSAAAKLLPAAVRDDVSRLYAWCRVADDLIDGQDLGHGAREVADPAAVLANLRARTDAALAGTPQDAVFDGFGAVARRHGISRPLAHDLLDGFALDVAEARYTTLDDLAAYCYGVAGAVGVMMALVLGVRPDDHDTLDRASDLGLAFQMTNIARDVVADGAMGRVYLPTAWLEDAGLSADPAAVADPSNRAGAFAAADRLVEAADRYYASAWVGVARLPFRTAWAIASAANVYREIGMRRRAAGPAGLATRARTTTADKVRLIARAALPAARGERPGLAFDRTGLWTRPPRP
ncbi:MAG: phytoene/squalene synthase family protein [Pseudomonadota bacterium]